MSYKPQTVVSDGTLQELLIQFEVIDRSTVTVYMEGVPVPLIAGLWSWVGNSNSNIRFNPTVPAGVVVAVKRTTNIDELLHQYSLGAQFRADTLDESFQQILHAAQEFQSEGALPSDNLPMPVGPVASAGYSNLYARADHVHEGSNSGGGGEGGTGQDGYSTALIYAYQRSPVIPAQTPGPITFAFTSGKITVPAGNALAGGWSKVIPTGTDPLWVTVCTAAGRGLVDTATGEEWTTPVILARDGLHGLNTATAYIYARTPTEVSPSSPSNPVTYNFVNGSMAGLNNGWTSSIPPSYGGKFLWVKTATAANTAQSDVILPDEWAEGQLMAQDGVDGQNGGANGLSNAIVYAYKRVQDKPTDNPGAVTYHFPSARITQPSTDALANGWSKIVPGGSGPLWVVAASASNSDITDQIAASEWTPPELLGSAGVDGLSVATLYAYRRTSTNNVPAAPTANVNYDFATTMITGLSNGWSTTVPSTGGRFLWVITATASSATGTDTIPPSEWATASILSTDGANGTDGGDGRNGQRGTVNVVGSASAWSNATANAAISSAGYGAPQNRDIVTLTNGSTFSQTRFYDNGSWAILTAYIDGNMLVTGTLSADKLTGGTISGVDINIANNRFRVFGSSGLVSARDISSTFIDIDNTTSPTRIPLTVRNYDGSREAIYGRNTGRSQGSHGVRGQSYIGTSSSQAAGLVGCNAGFDFYAEGAGTNYGPFTGAHDCLLPNGMELTPGDIVVDVKCVNADHLSNTIFEVGPSTRAMQPAIGVFALAQGSLADSIPSALMGDGPEAPPTYAYQVNRFKYQRAAMNSVGEGMLLVCGEGGDLKNGDLICTSSTAGKGMKQPDDVVRSYTVAKVRGDVQFNTQDEVRLVPCIYLCG